MEQADERIIEEVRKYDHLYNSSSIKDYKDHAQMSRNSWKEIAQNTGLEVAECMKRWKNLRDKYVRLRKRLATKSGGGQKVPALYHFLTWLEPYVKHRETDSNDEAKTSCSSSESDTASTSPPSASPTEPPRSVTPGLPATPSRPPASSPVESPVSRPKRKRDQQRDQQREQQDDLFAKQMADLEERKMEIQQKLLQGSDEYSRFGQMVADLLRRLPEDQRPDVMFKVYQLLHENRAVCSSRKKLFADPSELERGQNERVSMELDC